MFTDELKDSIMTEEKIIQLENEVEKEIQEEFNKFADVVAERIKSEIKSRVKVGDFSKINNRIVVKDTFRIKVYLESYRLTDLYIEYDIFSKDRPHLENWRKIRNRIRLAESNGYIKLKSKLSSELEFECEDRHKVYTKFIIQFKILKNGLFGIKKQAYIEFVNKNRIEKLFESVRNIVAEDKISVDSCYFKIKSQKKTAIFDLNNTEIPYKIYKQRYKWIDFCIDYSISL